MGQIQALHCARDADVREPPLLLHRRGIRVESRFRLDGATCRKQALFHSGYEHHREFEPLGGVHRDQGQLVRIGHVRILVGHQRRLLEQPIERVIRRQVVIARGDFAEFEEVRPAFLAFLGAIGKHRAVARSLQHLVNQFRQGQ